ncbi:MAG: hypothetical protein CMA64_11325 [Euryarchaeota archaeon]|nr:hypothetical protein [Euryarchaeota archaeon]
MDVVRKAIATTIFLLILVIQLNPSLINSAVVPDRGDNSENSGSDLVTLQDEERWLIVPIHFPTAPFQDSEIISLVEGEEGAIEYISQASGGRSSLEVTISERPYIAPQHIGYWGEDEDGSRDVDVQELVSMAVSYSLTGTDLSPWDLDADGIIDRILFIHGERPQEIGGGSQSIWSHFSALDDPIAISSWSIEHYTITSTQSGLGTVIHEMLHQMGALDLYDVHGDLPTREWNGIGDWGIMASGNWNDAGSSPALPTASTITLIDPDRDYVEIDPSLGGIYEIEPFSKTGQIASIRVSPTEYLWMTYRDGSGFDAGLPGDGLLVEYQDVANGDSDDNMLNSDPFSPWSYIVEADGDDALFLNDDSGSPTDAFAPGSIFGAEGIPIRDSSGTLVNWSVSISQSSEQAVNITVQHLESSIRILAPRAPFILLPEDNMYFTMIVEESCNVLMSSQWSASSEDTITTEAGYSEGTYSVKVMDIANTSRLKGTLQATFSCAQEDNTAQESEINIMAKWYKVNHKIDPISRTMSISSSSPSSVDLEVIINGTGQVFYDVIIDGPASQIATTESPISLSEGDDITLEIDPSGLLSPGMIARGEVVLHDGFGIETRIPFVLESEGPLDAIPVIGWLSIPSNGISVALAMIFLSYVRPQKEEPAHDARDILHNPDEDPSLPWS